MNSRDRISIMRALQRGLAVCFLATAALNQIPIVLIAHASSTSVFSCVTLSQPGSYLLMNDLSYKPPSTSCINIAANGATLDCQGHTITGPGSNVPAELDTINVTSNNSVVRNCIAAHAGRGVLVQGSFNLVQNNTIYDTTEGINNFVNASYNRYQDNDVHNNRFRAFTIWHYIPNSAATGNIVTRNRFTNSDYGIDLGYIGPIIGNLFYDNYIANNTYNVRDFTGGQNSWNIPETPGTNILGGPLLGGNFWSDYRGTDTDSDGLGDTQSPYVSSYQFPTSGIATGGDFLPLTLDKTAPSWPAGSTLSAFNIGGTSLTLIWTPAKDDFGVNSYRVYLGTILTATVGPSFTYTVSGLAAGTPYTFKVEAGDVANNWSTNGPSISLTTPQLQPQPSASQPSFLAANLTWLILAAVVVGFAASILLTKPKRQKTDR